MNESEFDQLAHEYASLHAANIRLSGEAPEYFARYKIADVARRANQRGLPATAVLDFGRYQRGQTRMKVHFCFWPSFSPFGRCPGDERSGHGGSGT